MRLPGHSNDREAWSWAYTRIKHSCASGEASTAYDDNPHGFPPIVRAIRGLAPESTARMRAYGPESLVAVMHCG